MDTPTLKPDLRSLIETALLLPYTSRSCKDAIETGNHYQSVELGGVATSGFRANRDFILDQIDFRRKKVLDLGSNLGEMSRAARRRGAWLVDGFEYDPFFIEVANAVNAHNNVSRVSFYQRDITDPASYREDYDIVLALSVFTYVEKVLPQIAPRTQLLVLETHKLDGNLDSGYLEPVLKYFRYYQILGRSDWGSPFEGQGERAVIAFAKEEHQLRENLNVLAPWPLQTSEARIGTPPKRRIDVARTDLCARFFEHYPLGSAEELISRVGEMDLTLAAALQEKDLQTLLYSGWTYWLLYLKGYLQYKQCGVIGSGNIYYDYLSSHYVPRNLDPDLCMQLTDPLAIISRIARRFRDLDRMRSASDPDAAAAEMGPAEVYVADPPWQPTCALPIYLEGQPDALVATRIDGWHRLFAARLFGASHLGAMLVEERSIPRGATVAVISKGDDDLLALGGGRKAMHFPQTPQGHYLGHHPADSAQAIEFLEEARRRGAEYLLIPPPSYWWLDHYAGFRRYLEQNFRQVSRKNQGFVGFSLQEPAASALTCEAAAACAS